MTKNQFIARTVNATIGMRGDGSGIERPSCLKKKPQSILLVSAESAKGRAIKRGIIWAWFDIGGSESRSFRENHHVLLWAWGAGKTTPSSLNESECVYTVCTEM